MTTRHIPLNFFGMPLGLLGLGNVWLTVAGYGHAPPVVSTVLLILAAVVWAIVSIAYLRAAISMRSLVDDLLDPVAAPFASIWVIVPMVLGAEGLYPLNHSVGRVVVDVFLLLTVLLGGWFTGQWIYKPLDLDKFHPGYFIPTVAGGLLAATSAADVGQPLLGELAFGLGMICWLVLGSIILGRLLFRPLPPKPLLPTLAIEVAPAALASGAYFALNGDHVDSVVAFLGGYGVLMVLAQLRLLPAYVRLPFMPSTWAFTFPWAAAATALIHWLDTLRPAGYQGYEYIALILVSGLIGGIALRTLIAIAQHQLLPVQTTARSSNKGIVSPPLAS